MALRSEMSIELTICRKSVSGPPSTQMLLGENRKQHFKNLSPIRLIADFQTETGQFCVKGVHTTPARKASRVHADVSTELSTDV